MSPTSLPKMFLSEREGWSDIVRIHPSIIKLLATLVVPLSVIPPLMYAYAELMHPGVVFPLTRPALTAGELFVTGAVFFVCELAMVFFMAMLIQEIAESMDVEVPYEDAYTLAAIAPVPLWLSAMALFVPSLWFTIALVALAWVGSVALIRHGVRPLLHVRDERKAHYIANLVTIGGVGAWISLMVVAAVLLSLFLAWWQ